MGRTLFLYIFLDLLKVFFLASLAMAGIMSFAGLLRPLTQHGLDVTQVGQMLAYFMPAMTNYSWPVAALFATTFVYGRLAADNELTACRALGVSYWVLMLPAILLGASVMAASLAMMLYIVPEAFLRAERVVYSNLPQLVANQIDRKQRIQFNSQQGDMTVFARSAQVISPDPNRPNEQAVRLNDVAIVTYLRKRGENNALIPEDFYVARHATAVVSAPTGADTEVILRATLEDGAKVPRQSVDSKRPVVQAVIDSTGFGPWPLTSPLRESARFMNIHRLIDVRENPEQGRRVGRQLAGLIRNDQQNTFLNQLSSQLRQDRDGDDAIDGRIILEGLSDTYVIDMPSARVKNPEIEGGRLTLISGDAENPGIRVTQTRGVDPIDAQARLVRIEVFPDNNEKLLTISFDLVDAVVWSDGTSAARRSVQRQLVMPMPQTIVDLTKVRPEEYLRAGWISDNVRQRLRAALVRQQNHIEGELHARFSFATSCMALVLVGAIIGMTFKSGNFVSAFAVSAIPAILSIVLIVVGQQMSEKVPSRLPDDFQNPLSMGLGLIWAGNLAVMSLAIVLYAKLRRS